MRFGVGSYEALSRLASSFPVLKQVTTCVYIRERSTLAMRKTTHEAMEAAPSIRFNTI
jgi:hypothetical protein